MHRVRRHNAISALVSHLHPLSHCLLHIRPASYTSSSHTHRPCNFRRLTLTIREIADRLIYFYLDGAILSGLPAFQPEQNWRESFQPGLAAVLCGKRDNWFTAVKAFYADAPWGWLCIGEMVAIGDGLTTILKPGKAGRMPQYQRGGMFPGLFPTHESIHNGFRVSSASFHSDGRAAAKHIFHERISWHQTGCREIIKTKHETGFQDILGKINAAMHPLLNHLTKRLSLFSITTIPNSRR